jgi:hypothetical protein
MSELQTRHLSSLGKIHRDLQTLLRDHLLVQHLYQRWDYPISPAMATNHYDEKALDQMGRGGQSHTTRSTYPHEFSSLPLRSLFHIR